MAASMSAESTHVVAWTNQLEWQTVYGRLYSDDVHLKNEAVERISAWKCRFGDQIPVSVECSASLVRAQIMDINGCSSDAVQLAYSIAIIRFVNLITGREQNRTPENRTVALLATKVGIPTWMVDMRHDAAHRFMPSLSMLREGAYRALDWLRKEYWEVPSKRGRLEETPEDCCEDDASRDSISECLIQYQQEQFKHQSNGESSALLDLEGFLTDNTNTRHMVAFVLLQDGFLVSTEEQLSALKIKQGFSIGRTHDIDIARLHADLITFWTPLLRLLHSLDITPMLLAALLRELAKFTNANNKAARFLQGWAFFIATEAGRGPTNKMSSPASSNKGKTFNRYDYSTKALYEGCKTIRMPWNGLAEFCLENPSPYIVPLIPQMLQLMTPTPSKDAIKKVKLLSSIFNKEPLQIKDGNSEPVMHTKYTLINMVTERRDSNRMKDAVLMTKYTGNVWTKCEGIDWKNYPLGMLPGQPDDLDYFLLNIHEENRRKTKHDRIGTNQSRGTSQENSPKRRRRCVETEKSHVPEGVSSYPVETSRCNDALKIASRQSTREIPARESPNAVIKTKIRTDLQDPSDILADDLGSNGLPVIPNGGQSGLVLGTGKEAIDWDKDVTNTPVAMQTEQDLDSSDRIILF